MIEKIEIARLSVEDYQEMLAAMKASYPNWTGSYWSMAAINNLINMFPEGQMVVKGNGNVVGCALSIIVDYERFEDEHTYKQITGNYTFETHDPHGDVLYGIEIFIHPDYRGLRLGRRMYDARKELCEELNLRAIIFGGRLPNYHKYSDSISPKEYIQKVKDKEIYDPVLSFLICYDVEFPELPRLLAEQGMQILFVPFLTDTQNAYMRVRCCAQARAIENECYVAISGSVGNLPKVENMDIQYSQAVVFTPCDFAFPHDGIKSQATPNTEMILISDVDLSLLDELHSYGSVRNLKDRRKDIYEVILKTKNKIK